MGVYNTFGERNIQLKVESYDKLQLKHYKLGDKIELGDGIYVGYEGAVVILDGIFIAEFSGLWDKWGGYTGSDNVIKDGNPVAKIIAKIDAGKETYKYPHDIVKDEYGEKDDK